MPDSDLQLVKVPLLADRLVDVARRRQIALRDLDDGYLVHCVLRELWQDVAPAPFALRGRGRCIDAWGYTRAVAGDLITHARHFGDPSLIAVIDGLESIASKAMPVFEPGTRVGFHLRACPVVRLAKARAGHRPGAEIDAFLARCFAVGPEVVVSREEVYVEWFRSRFRDASTTGAELIHVSVTALSRERLARKTQGPGRECRRLERPEVRFEGELSITDGHRFCVLLERGIGRHRAFGFGALMVVPPGTPSPSN